MLLQALSQALVRGVSCRRTRVHYDIDGGQLVLMRAEGFPNQALYAIATHGITDGLGGNRQPKARRRQRIHLHCERKPSIRMAAAFFVNAIEIRFATQSLRWPEA